MDKTRALDAFAALAQETRLAAFRLLVATGPDGVPAGEVARRLDVPHNTMSSHLAALSRAGLVAARRESRSVIYRADLDGLRGLLGFLLQDCCGGRPEICAPLIAAALPRALSSRPEERRMSDVTIWHNPACGTSRNVLGLIRSAGLEPRVVEYLKAPPARAEIADAARRMGITPRALLREKGTPFAELGLGDPALSGDRILDAMVAHPILINRPVVFTPLGVRLCRPSERVLEILPAAQQGAFAKEDGEAVVDAAGQRVGG